jgi:hypothetical protein
MKIRTTLIAIALIAVVANAQRSEKGEEHARDKDCPRGEMPWATPDDPDACTPTCTTDSDCPGTRCRVLGLMADDQAVLFADDIRDEILERQALVEESRRGPIMVDPPPCQREAGDDCSERRQPVAIEPTMPVMACETIAIQEQRMATDEGRE